MSSDEGPTPRRYSAKPESRETNVIMRPLRRKAGGKPSLGENCGFYQAVWKPAIQTPIRFRPSRKLRFCGLQPAQSSGRVAACKFGKARTAVRSRHPEGALSSWPF